MADLLVGYKGSFKRNERGTPCQTQEVGSAPVKRTWLAVIQNLYGWFVNYLNRDIIWLTLGKPMPEKLRGTDYTNYGKWRMEILKISRYRTSAQVETVQALIHNGNQLKRDGKISDYDEWAHLMWVLKNKYKEMASETR